VKIVDPAIICDLAMALLHLPILLTQWGGDDGKIGLKLVKKGLDIYLMMCYTLV
jgi:hypothetical protein